MGKIAAILQGGKNMPQTIIDYDSIMSMLFDGSYYYPNSKNLSRVLTFESTNELSIWNKENCGAAYSFQLDSSIYKNIRYGCRFELNKTDPDADSSSKRTELVQPIGNTLQEGWYGFAHYFPSDYLVDTAPEIVAQWAGIPDFHLGEDWRSPNISLENVSDNYELAIRSSDKPVNIQGDFTVQRIPLGVIPKNRWVRWVFHIKFSFTSEGVVEVWQDDVQVVNLQNCNNRYNDESYPYFKFGIYKWIWKDNPASSIVDKRVLYYDEVRIGNENATYNDVAPN
jgi:hypothetical protein